EKVISETGEVLFTEQDIKDGQNVWQSMGGQEVGSIWGHGAYVAPDWTADWLHREAIFMLDYYAKAQFGTPYESLTPEQQAGLKVKLQQDLRENTYDPESKIIKVSKEREAAIHFLSAYYKGLFMDGAEFEQLRKDYAI